MNDPSPCSLLLRVAFILKRKLSKRLRSLLQGIAWFCFFMALVALFGGRRGWVPLGGRRHFEDEDDAPINISAGMESHVPMFREEDVSKVLLLAYPRFLTGILFY